MGTYSYLDGDDEEEEYRNEPDEYDPKLDSFAWFDEYMQELDIRYKKPPLITGIEAEEFLEDMAAEQNLDLPADIIIENGKYRKIITEEDSKLIAEFVEFYKKKPEITMIVTIREDPGLAIFRYRNLYKAEVTRTLALAIAGTEKNEWWCLDWMRGHRKIDPELCLGLNLFRPRLKP